MSGEQKTEKFVLEDYRDLRISSYLKKNGFETTVGFMKLSHVDFCEINSRFALVRRKLTCRIKSKCPILFLR